MENRRFALNCLSALLLAGVISLCLLSASCKTPRIEPGGVYAPTNATGQVIYSDAGLALADSGYKLAYETILATLKFERDSRAAIWKVSPATGQQIKTAFDKVRAQVWAVDQRWALARKAYKANPTPAGMTAIQTILAEIQRIVPVVQSQLDPVYSKLTAPVKTP